MTAQIVEINAGVSRAMDQGAEARVPARVQTMGGEVLRGAIVAPDPSARDWTVEVGHRKLRRRLALGRIRHAAFPDPERAGGILPVLEGAGHELPFLIRYRDGHVQRGICLGHASTRDGVFLARDSSRGGMETLFIPAAVVAESRFGVDASPGAKAAHQQMEPADGIGELDRHAPPPSASESVARTADELEAMLAANGQKRVVKAARFPLGELLVAAGALQPEDLEQALAQQEKRSGRRLGEVLQDMGLVEPGDMRAALSRKLGLPAVELREFEVQHEALLRLNAEICRRHLIFPVALVEGHLVIATADPSDTDALAVARMIAKTPVDIALATSDGIRWAISEYYGGDEQMDATLENAEVHASAYVPSKEDIAATRESEEQSKERPVVKLLDTILRDAVHNRASDVHFRPSESGVDLLYRVDGQLLHRRQLSKALLPGIVGRFKVMGRMNSAERHVPQDGRLRMKHGDRTLDMRLSLVPTMEGESVVVRILNPESSLKGFYELGFSAEDKEVLENALSRTHGMVLVTGPTGSGKSSTLYAALQDLASRQLQVISVEDPVEYRIEGVEQIPVNRAKDLGFAQALRAILRHDPDAIMVGEIRDGETAKIAVESALTGHLVLSTIHTNSAAAALVRLEDMGVEPYLLSPSLQVVVAQRLVRRNCPECQAEEPVDAKVRRALEVDDDEWFQRGRGCRHCGGTGFYGRAMVYELLRVTPEIREAVLARKPADEINRIAVDQGMVRLTDMALTLARQGDIPLAEVYRVRID